MRSGLSARCRRRQGCGDSQSKGRQTMVHGSSRKTGKGRRARQSRDGQAWHDGRGQRRWCDSGARGFVGQTGRHSEDHHERRGDHRLVESRKLRPRAVFRKGRTVTARGAHAALMPRVRVCCVVVRLREGLRERLLSHVRMRRMVMRTVRPSLLSTCKCMMLPCAKRHGSSREPLQGDRQHDQPGENEAQLRHVDGF